MFRLLNKREATKHGKSRPGGHSIVVPSSAKKTAAREDQTFHLDIPIDDAMRALDVRLSSMSHIEVAQAAKERGWATLRRELERHPVRPTAPVLLKGTGAKASARPGSLLPVPVSAGHARGWRVALGSAGAAVVILAAVLGVYGAGLFGAGGTGPVAVTSTDIVAVETTTVTSVVTPTSEGTGGTEPTVTTEVPGTTDTTPVTNGTSTTQHTPGSTTLTSGGGTTPTTGGTTTPTTKPASTTTTNNTVVVSADIQRDAQMMAADLATAVINYFLNGGSISEVSRRVAPSAKASFTQMIGALDDPTSGQVVPGSARAIDGTTVRFTLEFVDTNDSPRFFVTVHVTDQGATITAISAAS